MTRERAKVPGAQVPSLRARTTRVGGTQRIASDQASPASARSARRLEHRVDREPGPPERREQHAERDGAVGLVGGRGRRPGHRARVPPGAAQHRLAAGRVEHDERRVGEREHERSIGAQHAVDLAEHAVEVGDGRQAVGRQGGVDRVGADERQLGERAVVGLDPHALTLGPLAGVVQVAGVDVDSDHPGTRLGQRHRAGAGAAGQLEHAPALDVPEQLELVLGGQPGAVAHGVRVEGGAGGAGEREAGPSHPPSMPRRRRAAPEGGRSDPSARGRLHRCGTTRRVSDSRWPCHPRCRARRRGLDRR